MGNNLQKSIIDIDREFVALLMKELKRHGKVKVTGLGIFEIRSVKSRLGYNPATKQKEKIRAYKKLKFTPTKALKDRL